MSDFSRRRFITHSAHTTIGVSSSPAAFQTDCRNGDSAHVEVPDRLVDVCVVWGTEECGPDEPLSLFQRHLEGIINVACSRASCRADGSLAGLENLDRCDCIVLLGKRIVVSRELFDKIERCCRHGVGLVTLQTPGFVAESCPEPEGGRFGRPYGPPASENGRPEIQIVEAARDHPILEGVEPFAAGGSLRGNVEMSDAAVPLLTADTPGHIEPVAWCLPLQGGRIFCTSLGHRDDFHQRSFLRLMVNAVFWTTRLP